MNTNFVGVSGKFEEKPYQDALSEFLKIFDPIEKDNFILFIDRCTGAVFFECHIQADKLINNSTVDVPLDPDSQGEYRANRDLVDDAAAFIQMKTDASKGRTFSNIIGEFNTKFDKNHPLKIIGGQHRYEAIKEALEHSVNEHHGIKIYLELKKEQRLDVQLISNTNIAVSGDLLDRMYETTKGPELRNWCQKVGLLATGEDFADKKERGGRITVRGARSFILSYFEGRKFDSKDFESIKPEPVLTKTGGIDESWEQFRLDRAEFWNDAGLEVAGKEFAGLNKAQYESISGKTGVLEYAEKALSYSVLSSWAYISGLLYKNAVRLERHYSLKNVKGTDPLNTNSLAKAKHKTDPENYRGLGARTDTKERGRLAELFYCQTEKGTGITSPLADFAIKQYHAKLAKFDAEEALKKV